jgi:hypothetical protein
MTKMNKDQSKVKAIALFSGGLDSIVAVKVIQDQGIDVIGLTFSTPFFSPIKAQAAAQSIGLNLLTMDITDEHLEMLRAPRYGYGRNMNPCIDCHTLMLKKAGDKMQDLGASFIFTGEVLGQRPMSQTKQSLFIVAKNSGYGPFILRPLSAKQLPITPPEEEGTVDRERLLDIQGRGRKRQIELAQQYGITQYGNPAGGCLLTDPAFSKRLRDLFRYTASPSRKDLELLNVGRHFRITPELKFSGASSGESPIRNEVFLNMTPSLTPQQAANNALAAGFKVIVGRNKMDNAAILALAENSDPLLTLRDYPGPTTLVPDGENFAALQTAASLCVLYSNAPKDTDVFVACRIGSSSHFMTIRSANRESADRWII